MTESGDRSRVLTLVFTDLADSTALKTQRGDIAVGELISRHREHVTRLAEDSAGRVIDWAGDGCFLTFETSSAAVMFALQLEQVHAKESDLPGVRIGIHMGEVTEKSGPGDAPRIEGLAVDIAARISGLARPGQVLMSASVHNSARQRLGVETFGQPILWQAHGTYELKGFDEPMDIREAGVEGIAPLEAPAASEKAKLIQRANRKPGATRSLSTRPGIPIWAIGLIVVLLVAVVFLLTRLSGTGDSSGSGSVDIDSLGPITSIAVLPLDNLTNDPDQDIFADGMTEAIIAELVKIKALRVSPRTSVMQYKDTTKTMPKIAGELRVDGIVEGSVRREGEEVQVRVQLIHGPTEAHLWSDSYVETITSVFKLQSDIALAIAEAIEVTVTPEEKERVADAREVVPEAYNAYLLGEHYRGKSVTLEGLEQALRYFEEAIQLDPTFAEALVGIGHTQWNLTAWAGGTPQPHYAAARGALRNALELDPDLPKAHSLLGVIAQMSDWDWEEADRRTRRAIELAPGDPQVHQLRAYALVHAGGWAEAAQEVAAMQEIAPRSYEKELARISIDLGLHDHSIELLESVLREDSRDEQALNNLVHMYRDAGRHAKALETADRYIEITRGSVAARTAKMRALAGAGREAEARALIQEITTERGIEFDPADVAEAYVMLGDLDGAFEWYEKAASERRPDVLQLRNVAAGVKLLKSEHTERFGQDPRYWDLVERIGFPPLSPEHPGYANEQAHFARKAAAEEANAPIRKIAVLPFENMSSDPEQEFFVDGMTEALIAELANIGSLKVISRTSTNRYKNTDKSLKEIARELDVDAVVVGSVLKAGDSVRITAQLIRGSTDEHLWVGDRTAPLEDVLQLQAEVALAMAEEINATVTPAERTRIEALRSVDPEAFAIAAQARHVLNRRDAEGFDTARELFERALAIDPDFLLARIGLADSYSIPVLHYFMSAEEGLPRAELEIRRVLAEDPNMGEAHASLGFFQLFHQWDWVAAEASLRRAMELSPNYGGAYDWYSDYLNLIGRYEEAVEYDRKGLEVDPLSPEQASDLGQSMRWSGQLEAALTFLEETAILHPDVPLVQRELGHTQSRSGNLNAAARAYERAVELTDRTNMWYLGNLGSHYAKSGRTEKARAILVEMEALYRETGIGSKASLAAVHAHLGDWDEALEDYEDAFCSHDTVLSYLRVWADHFLPPDFVADPRFQDLLSRMNFPEREDAN